MASSQLVLQGQAAAGSGGPELLQTIGRGPGHRGRDSASALGGGDHFRDGGGWEERQAGLLILEAEALQLFVLTRSFAGGRLRIEG